MTSSGRDSSLDDLVWVFSGPPETPVTCFVESVWCERLNQQTLGQVLTLHPVGQFRILIGVIAVINDHRVS